MLHYYYLETFTSVKIIVLKLAGLDCVQLQLFITHFACTQKIHIKDPKYLPYLNF